MVNFYCVFRQGVQLVSELIDYYGLDVVQSYMSHIQDNAEVAVREMLKTVGKKFERLSGDASVTAVDYLDDGSRVQLKLTIDVNAGTAVCDFT